MKKKVVIWTVKLTTDTPIDPAVIVNSLSQIGKAEVTTYTTKTIAS